MATIPNPWLTYSEAAHSHASDTVAAIIDPGRLAAAVLIPSSDVIAARTDVLQTVGATVSVRDDAIAEPSMTMEVPEVAPAETVPNSIDAGAIDLNATDCISEIFHVARKLLAEDTQRAEDFVDLEALEAALAEPLPLFLRDDGYLRRRA